MRTRRPAAEAHAAPISSALRPRRATARDADDPSRDAPRRGNGTAVALGIGVLLMAAALLLPSSSPVDAVPVDALQPVVAPTTEQAMTNEDDIGAPAPSGSWKALDAPRATTATGARARTRQVDGSSSASVAGEDLERAVREEAQRRKADASRARSAARAKARRTRARRAARARSRARAAARAQARRAPSSPSRGASNAASPPRQAQVPAAPVARPPAASAPAPVRRAPAPRRRGSASQEFGGGL